MARLPWCALTVGLAACAAGGGRPGAEVAPRCLPGAPVREETDSLRVPSGWLRGTRLVPESARRVPIVLLLAGSGPTDRNGNGPGARPNSLRLLAEGLAARGVATLRYDRRGIGASRAAQLSERDYRFPMLVDDAAAWVGQLRADPRFGAIVLGGHSEGSLVALLAAQRSPAGGVVTLAGPGRPHWQAARDQFHRNIPYLAGTLGRLDSVLVRLGRGEVPDSVPPDVQTLLPRSVLPYLASLYPLDPARELSRVRVPVLVVQGTTDLQVLDAEAEILAGSTPGVRVLHVPGMNHVLKAAAGTRFDQAPSYADPKLPVVPMLVDSVAAFVCRLPAGTPSRGR